MAQRTEDKDSFDNFPTPPWATRALMEHVIERGEYTQRLSCLEPACGAGHMAKALAEYFGEVVATDIHPYGYGQVADFTSSLYPAGAFDWVITNPPFKLAEEFVFRALPIARRGVARQPGPYSLRVSADTEHVRPIATDKGSSIYGASANGEGQA